MRSYRKQKSPAKSVVPTSRDRRIFAFLWKWKLASTRALQMKFFNTASTATAYNRLNRLARAGFIESRFDESFESSFWTLKQKGFRTILSLLPPLASVGFKSESVGHDALASAIHIGPTLCTVPSNVTQISEQQLRRYASEALPNWLPRSSIHRPDGYWKVDLASGDSRITALEVERSIKAKALYEKVFLFYEGASEVDSVLWFVQTSSDANRIAHLMEKYSPSSAKKHRYLLVSDFEKAGWTATECSNSEQPKSILELLGLGSPRHESPIKESLRNMTQALVDGRKT